MVNNNLAFRNAVSVFYRFRCGIAVFADFSCGIAVLGTPQCPLCKQGNDKPVMKCPFLRHLKSCGLNKRMNSESITVQAIIKWRCCLILSILVDSP